MVKSGIVYDYGMGFWGPNGHDGVWHISLIRSLAEGSWKMPLFAGENINNYHVGFDLLLAIIHKLTLIPVHTLYFQIIPPLTALFTGIFVYKFVLYWKKSSTASWWSTFFVYFGGGWGWIITLLRDKNLGGESLFWSQQSISTLVNPPFALSLLILFAGLYFLLKGLRKKENRLLVLVTFIFGILVQIKVYAGILILIALFTSGIWRMYKRKGVSLIKVFAGALIVSILIFSPASKDTGQILVFQPFWFLDEMMATPDRFYWPRMASALANYKLTGNWIKAFFAYGLAFAIFWFGNLGSRIIKEPLFFKDLKNIKLLSFLEVFLYTVILSGVLIPTFFIQRGTPWNTIQFLYYTLIFSGILAGVGLGQFIQNSKLNTLIIYIIVVVVVLLTIPTTIGTLWYHYIPVRPPAKISNEELEALKFLSNQPEGIVLTQPFDKDLALAAVDYPPRPLYLYESTAYVSAFSGKTTYLEDEVNLEITGYDWRNRREEVERFFTDPRYDGRVELLQKKGITYVYVINNIQDLYKDLHLEPDKIFENKEITIYKI
ncbi:hypothetical protein A3A75_01725 [Candidatus Woesebacteria bacterium RIFCSPLOWO2_01_FULL_39_10]|nr:MAG: hypothetical protein A3A75_01725 [Candidatus Woesebacteria bacterium RIFCSPLOWO2_01_FULL_39_10]